MSDTDQNQRFLSLIDQFLSGNLAVTQFDAQFTTLWMKERDVVYAQKTTWPEPYDELMIAAFQRGEMSGSEFRSEYAKLWGYNEVSIAFQEIIDEIHSLFSLYNPFPELDGEIDEKQLKDAVKQCLDNYRKLKAPLVLAN